MRAGLPFYEMAAFYPGLSSWYGFLSGMAFSLSFSVAGIFAGMAVGKYNRTKLLGISVMLWSLT